MELKRAECYKLMDGIRELKNEKINVKTAYSLIKNLKKIEEEYRISEEIRLKLVNNIRDFYAVRNEEDGSFEPDNNNAFGVKIIPEKLDEAVSEHMDYAAHLEEKVEIDLDTVQLKDLESLNIRVGLIEDLEPIIEN